MVSILLTISDFLIVYLILGHRDPTREHRAIFESAEWLTMRSSIFISFQGLGFGFGLLSSGVLKGLTNACHHNCDGDIALSMFLLLH